MADQRSAETTLSEITAFPCRELLLSDDVRVRAAALAAQYQNEAGTLGEMFARIAEGHAVDGMESLTPVLTDGLELLIDVMADDTVVLVADPERIRARAHELVATSEEFLQASWAAAAEGGRRRSIWARPPTAACRRACPRLGARPSLVEPVAFRGRR